jgi:hypothetical protein
MFYNILPKYVVDLELCASKSVVLKTLLSIHKIITTMKPIITSTMSTIRRIADELDLQQKYLLALYRFILNERAVKGNGVYLLIL